VKMNSHGLHDGIIRAWVNVYHGGTAVSPYDQHLYFDNVVIAREYIGPIAGTVPILQEEKHAPLPFLLNLLLAPDAE
jgi:hypothetical protein